MRVEHSEKLGVSAKEVRASARAPRWVVPAVKSALVAADTCVAVASFVAAYAVREGGGGLERFGPGGGFGWQPRFGPYAALLWFFLAGGPLLSAPYTPSTPCGEFSHIF